MAEPSASPLPPPAPPAVRHDADHGAFLIGEGDGASTLTYEIHDGVMVIRATFTPPAARGQGLASVLTQAAVDHARAQGLSVAPLCSYAQAWFERHPDQGDVLYR